MSHRQWWSSEKVQVLMKELLLEPKVWPPCGAGPKQMKLV